jgi:hypothetical protein
MGIGSLRLKQNLKQFNDCFSRIKTILPHSLTEHSSVFLYRLWKKNPTLFDSFITDLEKQHLFLAPHHFDVAIVTFTTQCALPKNTLETLHAYLLLCPDFELKLNQLFDAHASDLLHSAQSYHLLHHSLPHAIEMATRVDEMLDHLGIWKTNDSISRFLRAVTRVMVQFHDHEQKDKGEYPSVETATAARVSNWIIAQLSIPAASDLNVLITLMAERIIVLGTTMIYSPTATMDVSELFLRLSDLVEHTDWLKDNALNTLLNELNAVMMVVGVCDKNPSAFYHVVSAQVGQPHLSTVSLLRQHRFDVSVFEQFFNKADFIPPYGRDASSEINQQTILMSLVPHLSMCCELVRNNKSCHAHAFIDFISQVRQMCLVDTLLSMEWFDQQWLVREMDEHIEALFFASECQLMVGSPVASVQSLQEACDLLLMTRFGLMCADGRVFFIERQLDNSVSIREAVWDAHNEDTRSELLSYFDGLAVGESRLAHLYELDLITSVMNRGVSGLDRERQFSRSQYSGLVFVRDRLTRLGFSYESGQPPLILPDVPLIDAANLHALRLFYARMDKEMQSRLMRQVAFVVAMQPGHIQSMHLNLQLDFLQEEKLFYKNNLVGFFPSMPTQKSVPTPKSVTSRLFHSEQSVKFP